MDGWIFLLGFLQAVSCLDAFHYVIHGDKVNFEDARRNCEHEGVLTSLTTKEEVLAVQQAVSQHVGLSGEYTYWIGLLRKKSVCLDPKKDLKGFEWIDGGKDVEEIKWKEQPESTCTHDRCAYVSITYDGTSVVDWGLVDDGCKSKSQVHPFICKVKGEKKIPAAKDCTIPALMGAHDHIHQIGKPSKLEVICDKTEAYNLTCSNTLEWTAMDGIKVDLSKICIPCPEGHEMSHSGQCEDIDECETKPCGPDGDCVNAKGSFHCKDSTPQQPKGALPTNPHAHPAPSTTEGPLITRAPDITVNPDNMILIDVTESTPDYSHIYIPVIIAVLALLLLLLVILAIVACCRRRKRGRSKNLAGKKASKESMALKDSMEKVNEK